MTSTRSFFIISFLAIGSVLSRDAAPLFVAEPVTEPGLFTGGIEGPACDRDGNLYAVSFGEKRTIGLVTPDGKAEKWIQLPEFAHQAVNGTRPKAWPSDTSPE